MPEAPMLVLNPALDTAALAAAYAVDQRLQVRDVLTEASAERLHRLLGFETEWGMIWQAGEAEPQLFREELSRRLPPHQRQEISRKLSEAMSGRDYAFLYSVYPILSAYLDRWAPGGPHEQLLEELNSEPMLEFVRRVSGIPDLVKADAQATLYAANQFLAVHNDWEPERGRRVAYILNLCAEDWRPDWGGYLNFYDGDGDVVAGYRPRFNAINLFTVPQSHNVTYTAPFAPVGRFAITGWFRDR